MNHITTRIAQAAVAAALLETAVATIRSHSFYPVPIAVNVVMEVVYFLVVICVAALVASRMARSVSWLQRIVFFWIVLAPSLVLYIEFFRGATFFGQSGTDLVINHQITGAGYRELVLSGTISAAIALIATFIYFRGSMANNLAQVDN